jgi:hypothetical protein
VHVAVLHHELQHLARALRVGPQARLTDAVTDQALEIVVALLDGVAYTHLSLPVVARNPGHAPRLRGSPAVHRFLLDNQH